LTKQHRKRTSNQRSEHHLKKKKINHIQELMRIKSKKQHVNNEQAFRLKRNWANIHRNAKALPQSKSSDPFECFYSEIFWTVTSGAVSGFDKLEQSNNKLSISAPWSSI
jgi:hypothetical protein